MSDVWDKYRSKPTNEKRKKASRKGEALFRSLMRLGMASPPNGSAVPSWALAEEWKLTRRGFALAVDDAPFSSLMADLSPFEEGFEVVDSGPSAVIFLGVGQVLGCRKKKYVVTSSSGCRCVRHIFHNLPHIQSRARSVWYTTKNGVLVLLNIIF